MHASTESYSLPGRPHTAATQRERFELFRAMYDGKRLASFRRVIGALLAIIGAPIIGLSHTSDPGIRRVLTALTWVWLALVLPMVRLLCLEWHNHRLTERLRAAVDDDAVPQEDARSSRDQPAGARG